MAYPNDFRNLDRIEPHPTIPGASIIRYRDGSSIPAPAAIASRFDPSLAASGAVTQNMSVPEPAATMTDWSAPPAATARPVAPPQQAAPARAPAAAPVFVVGGGTSNAPRQADPDPIDTDTGLRLSQLQRVNAPMWVPGRAAYDPARDNASRQAVRESQTEQRSGMQAWDEEAQLNSVINQRQAIAARAEAENLQQQTSVESLRLYQADLEQQARDAQAQQRAEEAAWKAENDRLTREAREVASEDVDPGRVFSGARAFGLLNLAVAAALKGWVSKGQDNSVVQQLNSILDRDIALQQGQIERAKGRVDNALARNAQRYGSIEAGKAALKAQQAQATLARFDANAKRLSAPAQQAQTEATRQQLEAMVYDAFEQRKAAAQGTTTVATAASMRAPLAGSSGYQRDPTAQERARRLTEEQGISDRGQKINAGRLGNEEKQISNQYLANRGMDPAKEKDLQAQVSTYGQRREADEAFAAQMKRLAAENNWKIDSKGNLTVPDELPGYGVVGKRLPNSLVSHQGVVNRSALNEMVANIAISRFGAYNPEQGQTIYDEIIGDGRPETIAVNINNAMRRIQDNRDNRDASFSPEVVAQYERNKKFQRSRSEEKTKGFEPVDLTK